MRKLIAASLVGLLLCVSWSSAELVTPREPEGKKERVPISAFGVRAFVDTFKANEEAVAIASGIGDTCLGFYVFDAAGNCVAKDDVTHSNTGDDLHVRWVPAVETRYSVEVRNAGFDRNKFQIALR
ncbi:MAG: hypothetical protein EXR98_02765 [Gemmataceae bacterium]|nr:hypothetical protein [Gemmataceae bacterium]